MPPSLPASQPPPCTPVHNVGEGDVEALHPRTRTEHYNLKPAHQPKLGGNETSTTTTNDDIITLTSAPLTLLSTITAPRPIPLPTTSSSTTRPLTVPRSIPEGSWTRRKGHKGQKGMGRQKAGRQMEAEHADVRQSFSFFLPPLYIRHSPSTVGSVRSEWFSLIPCLVR